MTHGHIRWLPLLFCIILLAGSASANDVMTSGFGLFHAQPAGWAWDNVPVEGRITDQPLRNKIDFSVPVDAVKGLKPEKASIGLVSGAPGTSPRVWIPIGDSYEVSGVQSPFTATAFGQNILLNAQTTLEGDVLHVKLTFDSDLALNSAWDLYVFIDADGDSATGYLGAEYLLQNTAVGKSDTPNLSIPWLEIRPGIIEPGKQTVVTAWVQNTTPGTVEDISIRLTLPEGLSGKKLQSDPFSLRSKEAKRLTWKIRAEKQGLYRVEVDCSVGALNARRMQWFTVAKRDPRHECQTQSGAWLTFPVRPTLQAGNTNKISQFKPLTSAELKHNLFGITVQLPRSTNLEDPFETANAIDGDPATCWASRWWRTEIPFNPEWIELDLGSVKNSLEVRFLPAWNNSGLPLAFTIQVSADGRKWDTITDEVDYKLREAPEGSPLRSGNLSWQCFPFSTQPVRYARIAVTRMNKGFTSFFCCPYDPYQFRIAELAVMDGEELRSLAKAKVKVSTVHTAWYNTPEAIKKTWPLEFQSGVKINRISQWGDKTDWASVETVKGVYKIDPEVDKAIDESVKNGVDILLSLDYGNNLYQAVKSAPDFGPTWHKGHPFMQCAPTTPEALDAWAKWCGFMAKHFKGRVKYFEIWNEENGWFFDDWAKNNTAEMTRKYGRALKAAAKAVKEANPDAIVIFGGTAGLTLDFPQMALDEGAGPYLDAFAFHPYGHPTPEAAASHFLTLVGENWEWKPRPGHIKTYEDEIAELRRLLYKYNPKMQIWADEMNWFAPCEPAMPDQGDQSDLTQAKHLARFFAINGWLGCGAVWWSLYNANNIQEWAVVRSLDFTPRPSYYSAGYVSTVLDDVHGAPDIKPEVIGDAPEDLMIKTYRNGKGEVIIGLWRTSFADDRCQPAPVTLKLAGIKLSSADMVDSLYGYRQSAVVEGDVIPDLLVGDWPLFLRLK